MKCPECGAEMEKGRIFAPPANGIPWVPSTSRLPIFLTDESIRKKHGIMLIEKYAQLIPPKLSQLETYICRNCRKGAFDY